MHGNVEAKQLKLNNKPGRLGSWQALLGRIQETHRSRLPVTLGRRRRWEVAIRGTSKTVPHDRGSSGIEQDANRGRHRHHTPVVGEFSGFGIHCEAGQGVRILA